MWAASVAIVCEGGPVGRGPWYGRRSLYTEARGRRHRGRSSRRSCGSGCSSSVVCPSPSILPQPTLFSLLSYWLLAVTECSVRPGVFLVGEERVCVGVAV